ncbi:MAG: phenylacetate--CoA ligase family protein [Caldilineae bacterium]|nr:MAG: phenylacetate--CoA ligase family protein [Caldilineae bacterium]
MTANIDLDARLREMLPQAYEKAPAVRRRLDAAGIKPEDIRTRADLERVPVLPKDELVRLQQEEPPFGGFLAVAPGEVRHIFFSPGPLYEPETADNELLMEMALLALRKSGFAAGDIVLNSLSYHLVPAGLLLDRALVELRCTAVPGGVGNSELQVKMLVDLGVTAYVGTPSFLMQLLGKAEERGVKGRLQVEKAFVTAEPLPASLRERLVDEYGISVGNAYGTAELGFLALNTTGGMQMELLPAPIVEVVDTDTGRHVGPGEAGEVVVTNLDPAYPLIRLGTGDMAIHVDPAPGASRQEERAIILVGRSGEAVKVRGMFVHPNQLRFAVGQVVPGAAVQGVVTRPETRDVFTVRVAAPADASAAEGIKAAVQQVCRVRVDAVEFVEALAADAPGMVDERSWD